jgi:DNA-binding transcriptional ArsR family regulator
MAHGKSSLTKASELFTVFGDSTRRTILESLLESPKPVVELARGLPVSRPAVSQHLKVLKDAGLVVDRAEGNRRIYSLDPTGLQPLMQYLEGFWRIALANYALAADRKAKPGGKESRP